jgi:hypothetical protein
MEHIAPMLVLVVGALVVGAIVRSYFVNKRLRENARTLAELQGRLIDKFGDATEVVRYLESDAGKRLFVGAENGRGGAPARVLDSLQVGIVAVLGGVGLMAASRVSDPGVHEVMRSFGLVAMMVGVGFVGAAIVSGFMLQSWGLLPGGKRDDSAHEGD